MSENPTLQRGWAAFDLGRNELAIELAREALTQDPNSITAFHIMACAYHQLHNFTKLNEVCDTLMGLVPDYTAAYYYKSIALGQTPELGLVFIEKALEFNPREYKYHTQKGCLLNALGCHQEAVESLSRALALEPRSDWALGEKARALNSLKDTEGALVAVEEALRVNPESSAHYFWRGRFYINLQQNKKALESLRDTIRLNPTSYYTRELYGKVALASFPLFKITTHLRYAQASKISKPRWGCAMLVIMPLMVWGLWWLLMLTIVCWALEFFKDAWLAFSREHQPFITEKQRALSKRAVLIISTVLGVQLLALVMVGVSDHVFSATSGNELPFWVGWHYEALHSTWSIGVYLLVLVRIYLIECPEPKTHRAFLLTTGVSLIIFIGTLVGWGALGWAGFLAAAPLIAGYWLNVYQKKTRWFK